MKIHLLFAEHDYQTGRKQAYDKRSLSADLDIPYILRFMAQGDEAIFSAADSALYAPLDNTGAVRYRQAVLRDCLAHPDDARSLYGFASDALQIKQSSGIRLSPGEDAAANFDGAVRLLGLYVGILNKLRAAADACAGRFSSEGFSQMFRSLREEMDDGYLSAVRECLEELDPEKGTLISASLGSYGQGTGYTFRREDGDSMEEHWKDAVCVRIDAADAAAVYDLYARRSRAVSDSVNALAQSALSLERCFARLQSELAFYIGCLNLYDHLREQGMPVCIPVLAEKEKRVRRVRGLYDVSLALASGTRPTGSDLFTEGVNLYLITGVNQGGKSTYLRSVGQAQLMAQCGMFAAAGAYEGRVTTGLFTHFERREAAGTKYGKLDEELSRMRGISDAMKPHSMVLFNESFAVTSEREGSEICRQIALALADNGIEAFFVTHLFDFADGIARMDRPDVCCLRAEHLDGGVRTHRILPGPPVPSVFAEELYRELFPEDA